MEHLALKLGGVGGCASTPEQLRGAGRRRVVSVGIGGVTDATSQIPTLDKCSNTTTVAHPGDSLFPYAKQEGSKK